MLGEMAPLMVRKAGVKGIELRLGRPRRRRAPRRQGRRRSPSPGRRASWSSSSTAAGRWPQVVYDGPEAAVAEVQAAEFGI